jgi:stearoyl-CoA desaturase (delta-9 desaturase)
MTLPARSCPPSASGSPVVARRRRTERRIALASVVVPTVGALVAAIGAWTGLARPSAFELALTALFYVATVLGVTVGFHRMLTHRSFEATPTTRRVLAVLGCMALQGPPLFWVASHRLHHRFSDRAGDPHSPQLARSRVAGLWHAHVGWMFEPMPSHWPAFVADLLRDRMLVAAGQRYPFWVALGLVLPAAAAAAWHGTLAHAAMGALWGGLVRIFLVHHATWSVNSICHLVGDRRFATRDNSRNNAVVALLTAGEGWHNNHHAFPRSARHGLAPAQLDLSYAVIRALGVLGLATAIHVQISTPDEGAHSHGHDPN